MNVDQADHRMRAYAALEALRQSLPMSAQQHGTMQGRVLEPSIRLFETALDDLAAAGENIDQYRLPMSRDGSVRSVMHAAELQARVLALLGYFTIRDAVKNQATETGATLESLIGLEAPQNR